MMSIVLQAGDCADHHHRKAPAQLSSMWTGKKVSFRVRTARKKVWVFKNISAQEKINSSIVILYERHACLPDLLVSSW